MTPPPAQDGRKGVPDFRMEGLWAALARLDHLLEKATAAADAAYNAGAPSEPYRGLYISSENVGRLLKQEPGGLFLAGQEGAGAQPMPVSSRFPWLATYYQLTSFDLDVILIALAPEVDTRYERLFAYLQDDVTRRRPTVDLALNLLCKSRDAKVQARDRFSAAGPLVRQQLLHLLPDGAGPQPPLLAHYLKLDDAIVRFLLGSGCGDARLDSFARLEPASESADLDLAGAELPRAALRARESGSALHLYFEGRAVSHKRAVGRCLAANLKAPLLSAHMGRAAAAAPAEFEVSMGLLFREARMLDAILWLEGFDALRAEDRRLHLQSFRTLLEENSTVVLMEGAQPMDPRFQTVVSVPFPEPDFRQRRAIWEAELKAQGITTDALRLDEFACRYRMGTDQIHRSIQIAIRQSALRDGGRFQMDHLRDAARAQSQRDLGSLARRVAPVAKWENLVLPPDQTTQLKEVCQQARYRHVVFEDWGFNGRLSLGKGLSALFSGPPGTGKTMAAEVIANDLGLELYKIDLSQVVSKYIGETEKNLDRLFNEAREANAILFFDECDALFGKRTTVQDAHDRYANIEIAYLLQKMDEYDGLCILATNLRQNLDPAFLRRLTFIVEFPFPDEASRRRIWLGIWPNEVPRSKELDLDFMASQFKLPGGAVKNIAVSASFLAAVEEKPEVTTARVLWATRRELEKAGRTVTRAEFGRYASLMQPSSGGRDDS